MSDRPPTQITQIRQALAGQIDSGLLTPGMKLPSERELCELFDTTRITLKDALLALEAEGLIYREERRGWFVAYPRLNYNPLYRTYFQRMVTLQKREVETRVVATSQVVASPVLCREMELAPLTRLYQICRLRYLDGRAVSYVEHFLKPERFPNILERDLSKSLTLTYMRHYDLHFSRSRFEIYPSAARGEVAQHLNVTPGSPILMIARVNYDQHGMLVDCDHEYWRHDAVRISVDSQAEQPLGVEDAA
ncbi:UTRA domain-containing protein [Burkholderia sp. Bp8963]|uniref:UTRA domain-containing protein n=1 Tax=unclassified Burkholderia TaxID=2613784 RepID=UPI000F5A7A1E|nr:MULTISPECIES: UTRA domain-containing protein [unclassified Burkholderia]MBN3786285.1 UTRA domain-containing protein [Burkholderia sp. Ac-20353]RQS67735.1 UTRA domain-containing protein [Burkholderia sp. Bp8963]